MNFRAGFHLKRNELEEFKLDVSAVKVLIKFNASVEAAKGSTEAQWDFDRGINNAEIKTAIQEGRKKRNEVISEWI